MSSRSRTDSDFGNLDEATYNEYRFRLLSEARGVEHFKKLAELRKMTMCEQVWYEIRDLMNMQKAIQLGSSATRREV
jgi:hypothetical protein